jgi:hypothetical protein
LDTIGREIEEFVSYSGWDLPPALFALVPTRILAADPAAAALLAANGASLDPEEVPDEALTPVAQEALPEGPLDEVLAGIAWPAEVVGVALSQEITMLPPSAETELEGLSPTAAVDAASGHPDLREARLVVSVLRDGTSSGLLRFRGEAEDKLLSRPDLAPNLVDALMATLAE